jgi:hypothetical protein
MVTPPGGVPLEKMVPLTYAIIGENTLEGGIKRDTKFKRSLNLRAHINFIYKRVKFFPQFFFALKVGLGQEELHGIHHLVV